MSNDKLKKLGIIGGLGPAATVRLFERIVELTNVDCDQDHLDITVLNRPQIPDRTAFLLGREGAQNFVGPMQQAARDLEAAGCEVLCTPCNTAHSRYGEIAGVLEVANFVHMPRVTAAFAKSLGCTRVGILATDGALAAGVYQDALTREGLAYECPAEKEQATVMSIIYDEVKAGRPVDFDRFRVICGRLLERDCDGIILGCTELSCIGAPTHYMGMAIIDALDVLAWRCVCQCGAPAHDLTAAFTAEKLREASAKQQHRG